MKITRRSLLASSAALAAQPGAPPPNIVFLISDDHSAADLGCYGNASIRTPHLDRMAREGARFNHGYVSSAQCSPNRSSIFTGCAPHTTATSRLHTPLPEWEPTFLEPLRERGYFAGIFRKHHQGAQFEKDRLDFYGGAQEPFEKFFDAIPKGKPFFLQIGFTDPHRPYADGAAQPPHDPKQVRMPAFLPDTPTVRKDLAHYADEISRMDGECGRLFDILRKRGLDGNTFVLFTGDNGMPFPRAKGTCYDAGLRTPLLAWWPGKIAPGQVRDELIAHVDFAPTWLEAAGLPKPKKMQGRSFLPLVAGGSYQKRTEIFAERNWHDNFDPIRAVRTEKHKLIFNAAPHFPYRPAWDLEGSPTWEEIQRLARAGRMKPEHMAMLNPTRPLIELYDLEKDPDEFRNVANHPEYAEVRHDLMARLSRWMHETYDYLPPAFSGAGEPRGRSWPVNL